MAKPGQGPLDETIHAQARLSIVAFLAGLESTGFTALRDALGMTDGNLSTHLRKLEDAGYVETDKKFIDRKPHTSVRLTKIGRQAFADYLRALEQLLGKPQNPGDDR
jgi:DNA-binding MarR family transcriptional regulator